MSVAVPELRIVLLAIGLWAPLAACDPAATEPAQQSATRPDKTTLYADASLLPTHAGEQARAELAVAGELAAALEHLELHPLQIDVRLGERASAVVIAGLSADDDPEARRADVVELCQALVPELDAEHIHLWLRPPAEARSAAPDPAHGEAPPWAFALACIGLGLSLGVTLERLRDRRSLARAAMLGLTRASSRATAGE